MKKMILSIIAIVSVAGAVAFAKGTTQKSACCKKDAACCYVGSPCCTK